MEVKLSKKRISMLPAGDINAGSSRLRCFFLADQLSKLGFNVVINSPAEETDILFVQKRISKTALECAVRTKAGGGLVIYDIDDFGPALEWLKIDPYIEREFLGLCDALLVDTPIRLAVFSKDQKYAGIPRMYVLPAAVDYFPWRSELYRPPRHERIPRGAWFGNAVNLAPAIPFIQEALAQRVVSGFDVITAERHLAQLAQRFPSIGYKPWKLKSFAATLQRYHFAILIHDLNIEGAQKSNNKMLAALALGVVPFVSATPAYSETAEEIGLVELVIQSPDDLVNRLMSPNLLADLRARLQEPRCQSYIQRFSPENIAIQFLGILENLSCERHPIHAASNNLIVSKHGFQNG